jgi:hypothetical protein
MKLTLTAEDDTETTFEAELLSARGDYLSGTLRFEFRGVFPVDPKPFMPPPVPKAPPGGGGVCYEVPYPKATVGVRIEANIYECEVESVRSDGFTLNPRSGANLRAIKQLRLAD